MSDGTAPGHLYFSGGPQTKADISAIVPATLPPPPGSPKKKNPPGGAEHQPTCKLHQRAPRVALATRLPLDRALEQWQNGPILNAREPREAIT
jgi:hypothetical protein